MLTLSFGYKKPQTGDKGSVFFPALEQDIQQLNDHNHEGTNSAQLTSKAISHVSQTILAAGWVLISQGTYRQAVTMPAGLTYASKRIAFKEAVTGDEYMLSTEMITANSYYVYIADNTISLTALYI
jgi:hypothetical protein